MSTQSILIENGRVVDPSQQLDKTANLLIANGKIVGIDVAADDIPDGVQRVDATDKIVTPGLVDMHVHLRQPGYEEAETVATGARAALHSGFTSIACPPNTDPPIDSQAHVALIYELAASARQCNVFPICCISKGREGKELAELGILFESGNCRFAATTGVQVEDSELMRRALEYCKMFDKTVLCHEESTPLAKGGIMHEGYVSNLLDCAAFPEAGVMVSRDIALAER